MFPNCSLICPAAEQQSSPTTRHVAKAEPSRIEQDRSIPPAASPREALLAELVELGREAWRISERERAIRAKINILREIEENT